MFGSRGRLGVSLWGLSALWLACSASEAPLRCSALGEWLAPGEARSDPEACLRCVCSVEGEVSCLPLPDCPRRPELDAGGPADARASGPGGADAAPDRGGEPGLDAEARRPAQEDPDGDGQPTDLERAAGTDPFDPDSFVERFVRVRPGQTVRFTTALTPRLRAADLAFVVDSTGSMGPLIEGLRDALAQTAEALADLIPRARYGVADYRDYWVVSGDFRDFPFRLLVPLDADVTRTVDALRDLSALGGGDIPESAYEALQQVLTGAGYDHNCDGVVDPPGDVVPYITHRGDAFGGEVEGWLPDAGGRRPKDGGIGFDASALPIVILATDAPPRDVSRMAAPGGCPFDATEATVLAAAQAIGARIITVWTQESRPPAGYANLARETGALSAAGEPLVLSWQAGAPLQPVLLDAVSRLLGGLSLDDLRVEAQAQPGGLGIQAAVAAGEVREPGRPVEVEVELTGEWPERTIIDLTLQLMTADGVLLDQQVWWVLLEP